MTYSDDILSRYLDGQADAALAEEVERAMAGDPALVARMERLESDNRAPRAARSQDPAERAADLARSADILAFKPRPKAKAPSAINWPKLAAASVAALLIGAAVILVALPRSQGPAAGPADGLAPGAALAAALSKTPSGVQAPVGGEMLRVALSFRSRDGRLCRQFHLGSDKAAADGLACHGAHGWRIEGWMAGQPAAEGGYQTAGGEDAITGAMVDRLGLAATLDQAGEVAAIKSGWR